MTDKRLAELIRLFAQAADAAASHQDEMTKRVIRSITKGAQAVAEELEKVDVPTDKEMIDWLEEQAKKHSRTGISLDWVPAVEGEPSGFRFMRRRFIGDPKKGLRSAIADAMDRKSLEK